jgi:hypothetical protein
MATRTPATKSAARTPPKSLRAARPAAKRVVASKRPAARPAQKAEAKAAPAAPAKPPKLKLVRDSFTIPEAEYGVLGELKRRTAVLGRPAKKSELLRAGVKLLAALGDDQLAAAMQAVPSIKTGRPKAEKGGKKSGKDDGGSAKKGKAAAAA